MVGQWKALGACLGDARCICKAWIEWKAFRSAGHNGQNKAATVFDSVTSKLDPVVEMLGGLDPIVAHLDLKFVQKSSAEGSAMAALISTERGV